MGSPRTDLWEPAGRPAAHSALCRPQAQRYVAQLKGQVNALEAELEEQRKQKQKALVDNEQLRHELAQLQAAQREGEQDRGLREEAERECRVHGPGVTGARAGTGVNPTAIAGRASATELRYSRLKEKHSELINTHAELLRKVGARQGVGRRAQAGGQSLSPSLPT